MGGKQATRGPGALGAGQGIRDLPGVDAGRLRLAANHVEERPNEPGQIPVNRGPDNPEVNIEVAMNQPIPCCDGLFPRESWMLGPRFGRGARQRFPDNLQKSYRGQLQPFVLLETLERHSVKEVKGLLCALQSVPKPDLSSCGDVMALGLPKHLFAEVAA